jgi:hypothetical protein
VEALAGKRNDAIHCPLVFIRTLDARGENEGNPPKNVLQKVAEAFQRYGITQTPLLPLGDIFVAELKKLRDLARRMGGELISDRYLGSEKHEWKCGIRGRLTRLGEVSEAVRPDAAPGYHFKRIGLEAGPLSQWLFSALAEAGLPVICVDRRRTSSPNRATATHARPSPAKPAHRTRRSLIRRKAVLWTRTIGPATIRAAFSGARSPRTCQSDPLFGSSAEQLGKLALRHAVPAIYQFREFATGGGLVNNERTHRGPRDISLDAPRRGRPTGASLARWRACNCTIAFIAARLA